MRYCILSVLVPSTWHMVIYNYSCFPLFVILQSISKLHFLRPRNSLDFFFKSSLKPKGFDFLMVDCCFSFTPTPKCFFLACSHPWKQYAEGTNPAMPTFLCRKTQKYWALEPSLALKNKKIKSNCPLSYSFKLNYLIQCRQHLNCKAFAKQLLNQI